MPSEFKNMLSRLLHNTIKNNCPTLFEIGNGNIPQNYIDTNTIHFCEVSVVKSEDMIK